MFCPQCGAKLPPNSNFCKNCGRKINKNKEHHLTIDEYQNRLREWKGYFKEFDRTILPLIKAMKVFEEKRVAAAFAYDKRVVSYSIKAVNKLEEVIKTMDMLNVPEILKNYHKCLINLYIKYKQWQEYMINSSQVWKNFDKKEEQNLRDKVEYFKAESDREFECIENYLNINAKELDLEIPFPLANYLKSLNPDVGHKKLI